MCRFLLLVYFCIICGDIINKEERLGSHKPHHIYVSGSGFLTSYIICRFCIQWFKRVLALSIFMELLTITVWSFFSKTCSVNFLAVSYWNDYRPKLCNYLYIYEDTVKTRLTVNVYKYVLYRMTVVSGLVFR